MRGKTLSLLTAIATGALAACFAAPARAEIADDIDALMQMDLGQLSRISVASKKEESVYDAPSVVSVVTAEEIRRYGGHNLIDVLNRLPSFQYTSGLFFQNNSFSARGQSIQHYANRMLFLINGRPFRDSFGGGYNQPLFSGFPVSLIERLEVIRGPGSVLYGSSAFSAVINIVTRGAARDNEASIAATYGSHDYMGTDLSFGKKGADWNVMTALRVTEQGGWDTPLSSEAPTVGNFSQEGNGNAFLASAGYKDLSFSFFHGKDMHDGLFLDYPMDKRDIRRLFADIGYTHPVGEGWEISGNITHNRLDFLSENNLTAVPENNDSQDTVLELAAKGAVHEEWDLMFGATHERQQGKGFNTQTYSARWSSAYGQAEYRPAGWLKLVAGIQLNKPENIQKDYSPRAAAIVHFNENWGSKILYGEAFRSGYALETSLTIPGILSGNPSLKPEKIATSEAQLFYHDDSREAALTLYRSKVSDIIQRGPAVPGPGLTYLNGGRVDFHGVEFEGKAGLGGGWEAQGSFLWQENEDAAGLKDVTFSPNWTAKAGVSYISPRGFTAGLFDSYFGAPSQVRDFDPTVAEVNPQPGSYHLVTLNAEFDLNALLVGDRFPATTFSVFADNLLGKDVYYPEYNRQNVNSLPVHIGRSVYGTLKIRF